MIKETMQDDLAFIKGIIAESRKNRSASGIHLIVWGFLIPIGLIIDWFMIVKGLQGIKELYLWGLIIGSGWLFEMIYGWKVDRKKPVRTYAEKVDGFLWLSIGITLTILGFVGSSSGAIHAQFISPVFSTILAIGYFSSGFVYEVKWIRNLAFGWWGGAIIMFIFPGHYHLLLMAGMMIAFQTIPGFIIQKTWAD
ncbi:MAG: hypothetical protein H8E70_06185 [Candidatus Marinimicrobia bacterium]|nr:hypothetical protein [Candidatus Neomarinimicrobiota bacterium]